MANVPFNVLFLCTGNSARSIMLFINLPLETLSGLALKEKLDEIGRAR